MLNKKYKLDQYNLFSTVAFPPLASDQNLWKSLLKIEAIKLGYI